MPVNYSKTTLIED